MEIELVRPAELTPDAIARWTALQAADPGLDSPFLSPNWARLVDQVRDHQSIRVAVLHEAGRTAGFLPLRLGPVTAQPVGAPMCDYQGVIAEAGLRIAPRALVASLGVQRLDFSHWLSDQADFAPFMRGRALSRLVDVGQGYAAYEADRREAGTSVLKDTDKKRRRAEKEMGAATFTAISRSATDFDQMIAWKRDQLRRTRQIDIFDASWTTQLMRELFASRDPDFGGALFTLHFGDRLAAAQLNLRSRRTIHGWIIAHDPELERHSPGMLLFQHILRWMDGTPYQILDLGPGDARFKAQLSNAGREVGYGFVGNPSAATLMRTAAYSVRRAAEALPLGRVSELPGKAMRRMDQWRGLR